jgi:pimeloyl-ACP methyl ester carboxylesterase
MLTEQTLELPGGARQIVYAAGEGPPLVWLHAANGVEPEHPVIAGLARHHAVVAPLAPGFQDLSELDEIQDVHDLALHYDDVLEAAGIEQAVVVGHSFGGMIAAELASHFPKRASRLVLLAPLGLWNSDYPVADMFAVPYPELPRLLYAETPVAATEGPAGEDAVDGLVRLAQGMTTVAKFVWPIPDRGLSRRLRRVSAPTLVVFGEQDALVPARYADDFVRLLPDAAKVIVPGAGHMVPIERPDEVLASIEGFLGVGAPAAA